MSYWPMSTSHLHLGWLHKVRERRQTLCPLRNMWLAWLDREFGMLQGKHRRMLSLWGTFRHHWVVGTARGPFKIEANKYKHMKLVHCTLSTYLIRWRAFELSEDSLRNWRDISVRVLSSTCGATMKVTTTLSCSSTRRVARIHKGLMCPIK